MMVLTSSGSSGPLQHQGYLDRVPALLEFLKREPDQGHKDKEKRVDTQFGERGMLKRRRRKGTQFGERVGHGGLVNWAKTFF